MDRPELREIEDIIFEEQCHLSCSISEDDNEQVIHEIATKIKALIPDIDKIESYWKRIIRGLIDKSKKDIEKAEEQERERASKTLASIEVNALDDADFRDRVVKYAIELGKGR